MNTDVNADNQAFQTTKLAAPVGRPGVEREIASSGARPLAFRPGLSITKLILFGEDAPNGDGLSVSSGLRLWQFLSAPSIPPALRPATKSFCNANNRNRKDCHVSSNIPRHARGLAGTAPGTEKGDIIDSDRRANRRLRFAIMQIADNLITCNHCFGLLAGKWRLNKDDPRLIRVRVAMRFCRISFQMVAGGNVFDHPAAQKRDCILAKLVTFHHQHQTDAISVQRDLNNAVRQVPAREHPAEAKPLEEELQKMNNSRRGPQPLGEILTAVLAAPGASVIQPPPSGAVDPA
jgi:hypothetical protein